MTITLIVPIFNVEKYIVECLNSIVDQTVPFNEIILVDDGSTDDSYQICKRYADRFTNIILIHQENQGQGKARNVGIDMAASDYIMFCDADDYLDLHICEKMHQKWEEQDIEVGMFDAICVYEDGFYGEVNPYDRSWILYEPVMTGEEYFITTYPNMHVVSPCLMLLRKDFLLNNQIVFPEGVFYEDNVFFMKILLCAKRIEYISEKLYYRRYRQGSTINSAISEKKMNDKINVVEQIQVLLLDEIAKKNNGMLMYLSCYWNLYGDFLLESFGQRNLLNKHFWANIIYERYKESRLIVEDRQIVGESLSILGEHCLIVDLLKKMNVDIDDKEYQKMKEKYKISVMKLLKKLPLQDKDAVIGMYGTGKHTDNMIEAYEKLVGRIRCKIIYLETETEKGKRYRNQQVYCIEDKIQEISTIIISSFRYQHNMIKKIDDLAARTEIITLYDKNEAREINWKLLLAE